MRSWDITELMEEGETPETRAYAHALDLELLIVEEMKKQALSKKELAELMGIPPSRLSKLLNTQPNMTLETIASFEIALGIKLVFNLESEQEVPSGFATTAFKTMPEEQHDSTDAALMQSLDNARAKVIDCRHQSSGISHKMGSLDGRKLRLAA